MPTASIQIKWIRKGSGKEAHNCIQGVGVLENPRDIPWYLSVAQVIAQIETGNSEFWTLAGGKKAKVVVAENLGHKYIKTVADRVHPNNLLELDEWP